MHEPIIPVFHYSNIPYFSDMAGQTIIARFCFCMAIHAPFHRHLHPWLRGRSLALSDVSMTALALHLCQHHMTSVGKEDMIRLFIEALPGNLHPLPVRFPDLFLIWILSDGIFMAFQTDFYLWHAGESLFFKMGMAGDAFGALFLMFLVIERNRLASPET
jgi:hypothetical protein